LSIAVSVENEILARCREPASQSRAIAAILSVSDHAELLAVPCLQAFEHSSRVIAAPVVNHDHFKIRGALAQDLEGSINEFRYRRRIVVSGKKHAQTKQGNPLL
jgi:hypothetical protein